MLYLKILSIPEPFISRTLRGPGSQPSTGLLTVAMEGTDGIVTHSGFAAMVAVIELSPGPNFLLILRSVPTYGKTGALASCAGFSSSYLLHGSLAAYGVSALIAAEPLLLVIIQIAGACYRLFLGVKSFMPFGKRRPESATRELTQPVDILLSLATDPLSVELPQGSRKNDFHLTVKQDDSKSCSDNDIDIVLQEDTCSPLRGLSGCFRDGLLISAFNPKITLFYLAAFPQFILADSGAVANAFKLVTIHILICVFWTSVVAFTLDYALNKLSSERLVSKLNRFSGVALIVLSMAFFTSAAKAF